MNPLNRFGGSDDMFRDYYLVRSSLTPDATLLGKFMHWLTQDSGLDAHAFGEGANPGLLFELHREAFAHYLFGRDMEQLAQASFMNFGRD